MACPFPGERAHSRCHVGTALSSLVAIARAVQVLKR